MLDGEQWSQLLRGFIEEAGDLAREAEACLLELDQDPEASDAITRLFRAMHTLKGSAGLFSLTPLVDFTHHLENLLMAVRDGERRLDAGLVSLLLRCLDEINAMVGLIDPANGELPVDAEHQRELLDGLAARFDNAPALIEVRNVECTSRGRLDACAECHSQGAWHLSLRFDGELLRNGFDPASFVRYLGRLGDVLCLDVIDDALPALDDLDPEHCYLGLEIALCTSASKAQIEEVFEFIRDFCTLRILPPGSLVAEYLELIHALPEADERIGAILVASGLLTERELAEGLALQASQAHAQRPALGAVLVEQGMVPE
ncbi:MAG: Chemotaxis protein CheA [Pseudomonas citronellolis]|nr:MAG: Chemotaxis protein CheA [Pseudomonas citronellolis]